jgi:hypothetical protein
MRRTSPSRYIGLASLLLMLFLLSAGNHRALSPAVSPGDQSVGSCADPPTACKKPVSYLGESKGCACFACEYGRRTQKIFCTRSEPDKKAFKALMTRVGGRAD